jgi:hypothetical protein
MQPNRLSVFTAYYNKQLSGECRRKFFGIGFT